MDKRRKKDQKKSRRSDKNRNAINAKKTFKFSDIDNCVTIHLSPQTQRIIGCQIGEDITTETPWVYVKKEKIEDNLYLHDHSSEFLPVQNLVENYPEDNLLIGSYRTSQDTTEEFFICLSIDAKQQVVNYLSKEKEALLQRVRQFLNCQARSWQSLGSELEVNENQNVNGRNLLEVLVKSKFPIVIGNKEMQLQYKFASGDPEFRTYVEILPDRRFYRKIVFRVRIDRGSQISPKQVHSKCQTLLSFPSNKYTETSENFYVLKLTEQQNIKLEEDLKRATDFMTEALIVNFHINLYKNDYIFPNSYEQSYARDSRELMNFHDVVICKDLFCGSVSWNAGISGLVAASYVERPFKLIVKHDYIKADPVHSIRSLFDKVVLLWCYTDHLAAKLYMHVNFEVTRISFCPYDETILVGGGSGGQIVIWDLGNKMEQAESKEYLSITELNNRNIVRNHSSWIKWPPGVRHVFPTIISDLAWSHKSPVTSIQWLPSYQTMTNLGQIEEMQFNGDPRQCYLKPTKSYQFLTCSMEDSCILAWKINQTGQYLKPESYSKKKSKRLAHLPASLIEGISPLKKFNKNFRPFFKLKLERGAKGDRRIFATDLILNNPVIKYEVLNPHTKYNYRERSFLREKVPINPKDHSHSFAVCSADGSLINCNWTANNFDQGQVMNEQICNSRDFLVIHDGPIVSCRSNVFYPECMLTVGGSVFGIWVTDKLKSPVFWRKGVCRYVTGLWSVTYPLLSIVLREDNYIEFWDLIENKTSPMRLSKLKGNQINNLFSDCAKSDARKGTYLMADIKGVLKVHDLPVFNTVKMTKKEMEELSLTTITNVLNQKKNLEQLNQRIKMKYEISKTNTTRQTRNFIDISSNLQAKPNVSEIQVDKKRPTRATKWQQKEEIRMYETLVEQKNINLEELKLQSAPLMAKLNARLEQQRKIDRLLMSKQEIYENEKQRIIHSFHKVENKRFTVSFPREMEGIVKTKYISDYKTIETVALASIKEASRRFANNWIPLLGRNKNDKQHGPKRVNVLNEPRYSGITVDFKYLPEST